MNKRRLSFIAATILLVPCLVYAAITMTNTKLGAVDDTIVLRDGSRSVTGEIEFEDNIIVSGVGKGKSPFKLQEGTQWVRNDGTTELFKLYVKGEGTEGGNISEDFNDTLILETVAINNAYNIEFGFFDDTTKRFTLAVNQGAPGRATTVTRSVQIGKGLGLGPFDRDLTLAEGYNHADFNTSSTGADLGVEDDIEAKGSIYANEIVDANTGFTGPQIGHTYDTDLLQFGNGTATVNGTLNATTDLQIGGNSVRHSGFHRCSVTKSADQAINDQSWTSITFNQESYDIGGLHDNSTNNTRITIAETGEYRIIYHLKQEVKDKKVYEARVNKNNGTILDGTCDFVVGNKDSSYLTLDIVTCLRSLTAGDYIELQVWHDAGVAQNAMASNTFFCVERVW